MSNDLRIPNYRKRLHLPGVVQSYSRLFEEAAATNRTYQDYLFRLLDREGIQRDEHAQKLRLLCTRFPVIKSLDDFEFSVIPQSR